LLAGVVGCALRKASPALRKSKPGVGNGALGFALTLAGGQTQWQDFTNRVLVIVGCPLK
jgi:hypothetical protein